MKAPLSERQVDGGMVKDQQGAEAIQKFGGQRSIENLMLLNEIAILRDQLLSQGSMSGESAGCDFLTLFFPLILILTPTPTPILTVDLYFTAATSLVSANCLVSEA